MRISKRVLIDNFLYEINTDDKDEILLQLSEKFKLKLNTAKKYYKDFCEAMEELGTGDNEEKLLINNKLHRDKIRIRDTEKRGKLIPGKYVNYTIVDNGVVVNGYLFKNEKDIEDFRRREFDIAYKQLGEIADVLNSF